MKREILEKSKESVIRESVRLEEINKGLFLKDQEDKVPKKYQFSFEAFREQLLRETYDFEGLRLRLELYCALKKYGQKEHDDAWKWSFGENFGEDHFWRYTRLGFGYLLNCILTSEKDMPVLASKFLPFCTTYGCEFRKSGCLFSIAEDILSVIELLKTDDELKRDFNRKVSKVYQNEIQRNLYDRLSNFIRQRNLIPSHLGANNSNGDPYVTVKVLCHLNNLTKCSRKTVGSILSRCISNPQSKLYMPEPNRGRILVNDSPILKIKIAQLLVGSSLPTKDCENCYSFIEQQVTLATQILENGNSNLRMGPVWGRDRYSSIGWCSHSDVFTVITAVDFLLDVINSEFRYNNTILENGIKYLLNVKNSNDTWPVVNPEKFKQWKPSKSGNSWDSKEAKQIDERLFEYPEIFNISFSNTVGAIIVLLKALHIFGEKCRGGQKCVKQE